MYQNETREYGIMTPGQFHLEAESAERVASRRQQLAGRSDAATDAGLASLLIGLATRGSLTDSEKEFLDSLVPSHSLCFLVWDSRYLHPEGVQLLSADQLEASYLQGDAIFSHRQQFTSERLNACRVHAARVGEIDGKQITFGMIGPDHSDFFDTSIDRFSLLANRVRTALHRVAPSLERLQAALAAESPVMLVNRCSGRIVAANAPMLASHSGHASCLIDSEYGMGKQHLDDLLTSHRLTAKNVRIEDVDLSIITLEPKPVKAEELAHGMYARFVASLHRSTQALHTTADHLEGIIEWQPGHPETELLCLIREETAELEMVVHRYQLLAEFDHLRRTVINPAEELRQVVTKVAIQNPRRQLSLTEQWESTTEMLVPGEALTVLYDTILQIHLGTSCSCTTTSINLDVDTQGTMKIRFATKGNVSGGHPHLMTDWVEYITALSRLLGFAVRHQIGDTSTIETLLTHHKDTTAHE
jgi:hypothetical protein